MSDMGERIVAQARTWIGTPYHHAGRAKGAGVDCIGLPVGVARELGLNVGDATNYDRGDNLPRMEAGLRQFCAAVPKGERLQAGDVLVFRNAKVLHHVGIYNGDGGMLHVYTSVGHVVEQPLGHWTDALYSVWRYRGLD